MDLVDLELQKLVGEVARAINAAEDAVDVIVSLRCLSSLLRDSDVRARSIDNTNCGSRISLRVLNEISAVCRQKASEACPDTASEIILSRVFYSGPCFAALARLLLQKVSVDWLASFPSVAQRTLFDEFFTRAPLSEAIPALVDGLSSGEVMEDEEVYPAIDALKAACVHAERLLVLLLISKQGVKNLALSFSSTMTYEEGWLGLKGEFSTHCLHASQLAHLLSSLPDRTSLKSHSALRFPLYDQSIVSQLLDAAKENWRLHSTGSTVSLDNTMKFIGEVVSRLCRRGHAIEIASQTVPALRQHLHTVCPSGELSKNQYSLSCLAEVIEILQRSMWPSLAASITDSHALERFSEAFIKEMANNVQFTDWEAYCALNTFYGEIFRDRATVRDLFTERFLFWKVLPIKCLKWVLDFAILCSPPASHCCLQPEKTEITIQKDVLGRLAETWATKDFVQSAPIQQQKYVTTALGICLRSISKDTLESVNGLVPSILKGVSNRLDSPLHPVRYMAKQIALGFSIIVDPKKPLLIDDGDRLEDLLNWEGLELVGVRNLDLSDVGMDANLITTKIEKDLDINGNETLDYKKDQITKYERHKIRKLKKEKLSQEEDDPDAIVRLGEGSGDDDYEQSSDSQTDSESSLQPYNMSDEDENDDPRSGKSVTQLVDLATNLRKGDNPDAVEGALQVAEKLVLAMPEELDSLAADLTHALVHVKCSSVAVDGEEEISEERRQRALVALLSCSPLRSVSILTAELFSQHVDTSQRILILDVLSAGAKALANGVKGSANSDEDRRSRLVTNLPETTGSNVWYLPGAGSGRTGIGPWVEVSSPMLSGTLVGWAQTYERELPPRKDHRPLGRSRRWGQRAMQVREDERIRDSNRPKKNEFASLAAAFMLPVMRDYEKKRRGLDIFGRDFLVLGGILSMLGVCVECITMQREAAILGGGLLEMLRSRDISSHSEVFVRRTALFAASRVLLALDPFDVVASFASGTSSIVANLEWVREWALEIAINDDDSVCSKLATACVQLHSEMALQVQRSMGSIELPGQTLEINIPSSQNVIMPF